MAMLLIYEKRISLLVSIVILGISIIWLIRDNNKWEPSISALASAFSIYLQRKNWKIESIEKILRNPPSQVPQCIDTILDFAIQEYVLDVVPKRNIENYWRIGFKMSDISLIPINSQLDFGMVLFSIEQDADKLTMSYHNEQASPEKIHKQSLITSYDYEPFKIHINKGHESTVFTIFNNGHKVDSFTVPGKYRYSKVISWGDNHTYELKTKLTVIP